MTVKEREEIGRSLNLLHERSVHVKGVGDCRVPPKGYDIVHNTSVEILAYLRLCILYTKYEAECLIREKVQVMKLNEDLANQILNQDEGDQNDGRK